MEENGVRGVFWIVQVRRSLIFFVPFRWALIALWAVSHFLRAIGLTLAFHRYFAHRSFQMNRAARFVWAFIGTAAMQKGPLWWAGHTSTTIGMPIATAIRTARWSAASTTRTSAGS